MQKDPYEVLGVGRTASDDEIKKAYRRLAKKLHPDRNPGDRTAEERFKEVGLAFEILSDSKKRSLYDRFGHDGLREGFEAAYERSQQAGWGESGWHPERGTDAEADAGSFGFGDLFGDLFGGARQSRGSAVERGADVRADLDLGLAEALVGGEHSLRLRVEGPCPACEGDGADPASLAACPACGGSGKRQATTAGLRIRQRCPRCHGAGRIATRPCGTCDGTGTHPVERRLKVRIPAGARDGDTLRLRGQGAPGRKSGPPGDLRVTVHLSMPSGVSIDGDDLVLRLPVTVPEAFEGSRVPLRTPWSEIQVTIPKRSNGGTRLRVPGHGVPRRGSKGRGDLLLDLVVVVPDAADADTIQNVERLRRGYRNDPREALGHLFETTRRTTDS